MSWRAGGTAGKARLAGTPLLQLAASTAQGHPAAARTLSLHVLGLLLLRLCRGLGLRLSHERLLLLLLHLLARQGLHLLLGCGTRQGSAQLWVAASSGGHDAAIRC